jgi:hypothetical protein
VAAGPSREPAHLERLLGEQAVLDAFTAAAINVTLIGASHSEGQLGRRLPARVFIAGPEQNRGAVGAGADVLFLPERLDISVCETPSTEPGRFLYEIRVNGARVGGSDAARRVHHLVNERFFVIAYAGPSADALQRGLGLGPAPC